MVDSSNSPDFSSGEVSLLDYLAVIIKRRRMILRNTFFAAAVMTVISFLIPNSYVAKATLLPPDEEEPSAIRSLLANPTLSFLDLQGGSASSSGIYVEIIRSRIVAEAVLSRNYSYAGGEVDLLHIWDESSKEQAVLKLGRRLDVAVNEQGIIVLEVEMREPKLAAQVANAFVAELDRVNQDKSFSKARNSRIYIEEQLKITNESLRSASEALAAFQTEFKAVDLEEQTRVAITQAGEVKGTIMAKEVELEVALQTMKKDNPVILRLRKELFELKKQLEHLQFGNSVPFTEQKDYFIPFADVPEVGLHYAKLIREVKAKETVWQLLNQQYYGAKIQEARDTPTVQVLDEAVPPERRDKPKRALLVGVTGLLAFMLSFFGAFVLEYAARIRSHKEEYQKVSSILAEIRQDKTAIKALVERVQRKVTKARAPR